MLLVSVDLLCSNLSFDTVVTNFNIIIVSTGGPELSSNRQVNPFYSTFQKEHFIILISRTRVDCISQYINLGIL